MEEGDQVLLAVFAPAVDMSSGPQGRSAICIYSLQHIDTLFDQVLIRMTWNIVVILYYNGIIICRISTCVSMAPCSIVICPTSQDQ